MYSTMSAHSAWILLFTFSSVPSDSIFISISLKLNLLAKYFSKSAKSFIKIEEVTLSFISKTLVFLYIFTHTTLASLKAKLFEL